MCSYINDSTDDMKPRQIFLGNKCVTKKVP